jgi:Tfp pilus assembly protein PilP
MRRNRLRLPALLAAAPLLAAVWLVGCAKEEPVGQQVVKKPVAKKVADAQAAPPVADNTAKAKVAEVPAYDAAGRRDPFAPFLKPPVKAPVAEVPVGPPSLLNQDLGAFRYVGMIWTARGVRGLVEDVEGKGYTVTVGSRLGHGSAVVTRITNKEIVVREEFKDYAGATVVRESPLKLKSAGGK